MATDAFQATSALAWALDAVPMPVVCVDRDYRYLAFNKAHSDALQELYGTRPEQGHSLLDHLPVDADREAVKANFDRAFTGVEFSTEGWRGEGPTKRHYTTTYGPLYDEGRVVGASVVGMDTTESERTKELRALSRQAILNALDAPAYALDRELRYVAFNDAWAAVMKTSYDKEPHVGQSYLESLGSDSDREEAQGYFRRILAGETLHTFDWRGEQGIRRHWTATRSPVWSGGEIVGIVAIAQDTTEQALLQQEKEEFAQRVTERVQLLDEVVGAARDAIVIIDADEHIREFNQEAQRITGYSVGEVIGQHVSMLATPEDAAEMKETVERAEAAEAVEMPRHRLKHKDGRHVDVSLRVARMTDESGCVIGAYMSMRLLEMSAYYDDLTGLCNRRGLTEFGAQAIAEADRTAQRVGVLFADMDDLKRINDEFGHAIGDIALRDAAKLLHGLVREADVVARLGGDEFVVLTVGGPKSGMESLSSRLQAQIESFNASSGRPYDLSVSAGVVVSEPGGQRDLNALIEIADKAMYAEKERRRSERGRAVDRRSRRRAR